MPHDPTLTRKVRTILARHPSVEEKRMMGGIVFMLRGHMCCGVDRSDLLVRVGPERYEEALAEPHARPMAITGRALRGFVLVGPDGYAPARALRKWVERGVELALSLPPKARKKTAGRAAAKRRPIKSRPGAQRSGSRAAARSR